MDINKLMPKKKSACRKIIHRATMLLACTPSLLFAQYENTRTNDPYDRNSQVASPQHQNQQYSQQRFQAQASQSRPNQYPVQRTIYQADPRQSYTPPVNSAPQDYPPQMYTAQRVPQQNQFAQQENSIGRLPYNTQPTSSRSDLPSRATGMFERGMRQRMNVSRDTRAGRIGDLLTVDVKIETVVNNQDQRQLRKATDSDGNANAGATATESININYDSSSNRQLTGQTLLRETRTMTDSFQTRVLDVRNDILLIQGERYVTVQGDLRKLILSGQINRNDVSIGNRISSDFVYGMKLEYEGVGPEQDYIRQGWLKRQISKLWPF